MRADRLRELRWRIAQDAARLIHETGLRDYGEAKRKAALQLGIRDDGSLPGNAEVQEALRDYQALFASDTQPRQLRRLREAAIEAMQFFEVYQPRLVGAVLDGTADEFSAVCLHVFSDQPDAIDHFLIENGIPFDREERHLRPDPRREITVPAYQFVAGDVPIDITVFPVDGLRQAPLDRSGARPMERASLTLVRKLLDAN